VLGRKLELQRRAGELREAREAAAAGSTGENAERLAKQGQQHKVELSLLQQELAHLHVREGGADGQQQLREAVQQLYEELDEQHQIREDERVCSESEVRELRKERDSARDRLQNAQAELRRLKAEAEAAGGPGGPRAGRRGEKHGQQAEVDRLRQVEEAKRAKVLELEREQESLAANIGLISSQLMLADAGAGTSAIGAEALVAKAAELERQIARVRESCQQHRQEVGRVRTATGNAQVVSESLRRSYDELQKISDDRVFRVPQGSTSIPLVNV